MDADQIEAKYGNRDTGPQSPPTPGSGEQWDWVDGVGGLTPSTTPEGHRVQEADADSIDKVPSEVKAEGVKARPATASGAMRDGIGTKINTNLVPYELTVMAALSLNYGADKYEPRNFEKGLSYTSCLESIKRHAVAMECGEDIDEDSALPHLAMLAASVAMMCHNYLQGVLIDDRPIPKLGKDVAEITQIARKIEEEAKSLRGDTK